MHKQRLVVHLHTHTRTHSRHTHAPAWFSLLNSLHFSELKSSTRTRTHSHAKTRTHTRKVHCVWLPPLRRIGLLQEALEHTSTHAHHAHTRTHTRIPGSACRAPSSQTSWPASGGTQTHAHLHAYTAHTRTHTRTHTSTHAYLVRRIQLPLLRCVGLLQEELESGTRCLVQLGQLLRRSGHGAQVSDTWRRRDSEKLVLDSVHIEMSPKPPNLTAKHYRFISAVVQWDFHVGDVYVKIGMPWQNFDVDVHEDPMMGATKGSRPL